MERKPEIQIVLSFDDWDLGGAVDVDMNIDAFEFEYAKNSECRDGNVPSDKQTK